MLLILDFFFRHDVLERAFLPKSLRRRLKPSGSILVALHVYIFPALELRSTVISMPLPLALDDLPQAPCRAALPGQALGTFMLYCSKSVQNEENSEAPNFSPPA